MASTHLHYQITNADIGREFVKLGIIIPLSFALVGSTIIYHGEHALDNAALYALIGIVGLAILFLQGVAWWYFRHPDTHEFEITDSQVKYKTSNRGYEIALSDIQKIVTSRIIGSSTSRIDYFIETKNGQSFAIPKIHRLPDGKIIRALMKANPAITKE